MIGYNDSVRLRQENRTRLSPPNHSGFLRKSTS
nr:MAG TPA: hypothetical protein [Caudoviricetes sp.]